MTCDILHVQLRHSGAAEQDPSCDDALGHVVLSEEAEKELREADREQKAVTADELSAAAELQVSESHVPASSRTRTEACENSTKFSSHKSFGIIGVARCKKGGVKCYHCNTSVAKGDVRFEYVFNLDRPQRSIHPHCLAQMDRASCKCSLSFLKGLLHDSLPTDREEHQACTAAVDMLSCLV